MFRVKEFLTGWVALVAVSMASGSSNASAQYMYEAIDLGPLGPPGSQPANHI